MKALIRLYSKFELIIISIFVIYSLNIIKEEGFEGIGVLLLYISWVEVVLRRMYYRDLEINKCKVYRLSKEYLVKIILLISIIVTISMIILGEYKGELCIIYATFNTITSYLYVYSRCICSQTEIVVRGHVLTNSDIRKVELERNRCIITKKDNKKICIIGDLKMIDSIYTDVRSIIDNKE